MGETMHGGLAELCCVRAHQLVQIPDDVSFVDAAALPVAYGTAHRMLVSKGNVSAGDKVMILGASGGVGVCCVQLAKQAGAEVVACAGTVAKTGAPAVARRRSPDQLCREAISSRRCFPLYGKPSRRGANIGNGLDVVVNFTGGDTWVKSMRCLKVGGRLLTCGATAGYDPQGGHPLHLDIRTGNSRLQRLAAQRHRGPAGDGAAGQTEDAGGADLSACRRRRGAASDRGSRSVRQDRGGAMSEPLTAAQLQELLARSPFIRFLGLTVIEADPARQVVTMTLPMRPEFERIAGSGQWHGGPIAAIIDTVGDYALVMSAWAPAADDQFPRGLFASRDEHGTDSDRARASCRQKRWRGGRRRVRREGQPVAIGRASYSTQSG